MQGRGYNNILDQIICTSVIASTRLGGRLGDRTKHKQASVNKQQ